MAELEREGTAGAVSPLLMLLLPDAEKEPERVRCTLSFFFFAEFLVSSAAAVVVCADDLQGLLSEERLERGAMVARLGCSDGSGAFVGESALLRLLPDVTACTVVVISGARRTGEEEEEEAACADIVFPPRPTVFHSLPFSSSSVRTDLYGLVQCIVCNCLLLSLHSLQTASLV